MTAVLSTVALAKEEASATEVAKYGATLRLKMKPQLRILGSRVMTEAASLIGFQGQSTPSMTATVLWIMCWAVVIQKALVLEWRRQWV